MRNGATVWVVEWTPSYMNARLWKPTRRHASVYREDAEKEADQAREEYPDNLFRVAAYTRAEDE